MHTQKKKIIIALKKARTSIDKIITQLESSQDTECYDVMQQTLSAIGLLKNANDHILEQHLTEYLHAMIGKTLKKQEVQRVRDTLVQIVHTAQNK